MRKLKKPLLITTGALILVAAAVLGVLSVVKTSPWELTYHIVPSDVTSVIFWKGAYSSQLTQDEIVSVVHILNRLDKPAYSIKYRYSGPEPEYGLIIKCGDLEIMISQSSSKHADLVMTFDQVTSKTFLSGQWYLDSDDLTSYINTLMETRSAEIPKE